MTLPPIIHRALLLATLAATVLPVHAAAPRQCQQQTVQNMNFEMCLQPGAAFRHDLYLLSMNGQLLAALVDDFAKSVVLEHTVPEGPSIEFPLSRQAGGTVQITGGCVPVSKDDTEVARVCNFQWGKVQVIKDVRFEFN